MPTTTPLTLALVALFVPVGAARIGTSSFVSVKLVALPTSITDAGGSTTASVSGSTQRISSA